MRPSFLLNFSTHKTDLALFENDWQRIGEFVYCHNFNGIELYPVERICLKEIPEGLVKGLHLRFFVMIREIWKGDMAGLKKIFGSMENIRRFYGGTDRSALLKCYVEQMDLAKALGCSYVVFHPAHVCMDHVFDWEMDLKWHEVLDISCQIMNQALLKSGFDGYVLFENLWWPGSFNLGAKGQFEFIRSNMKHKRCGIVLDTGHLLLESGGFDNEDEAISCLEKRLQSLSYLNKDIIAIHLTCTLSGSYIKETKRHGIRPEGKNFWQRFSSARRHVIKLDRHDAFTLPGTENLVRLAGPEYVVFEFFYNNLESWKEKIEKQKRALGMYWL